MLRYNLNSKFPIQQMSNIRKKYKFDSIESQKLFEEFTLLLEEITEYVDEKERYIRQLENGSTKRDMRIREMVSEITRRLMQTLWRLISFLPKKLVGLLRKK